MKIKKKNSNKDFFLFDVIIKEKFLFLFILIVTILFTISSAINQSSKLKEMHTKVFIELPNSSDELFYLTNTLSSFSANNSALSDFKYFKNKFSYDLSSLENLLDFLNLEKNLKYLENFNKNNLDAETYIRENFKVLKDGEFDTDFLISILMIHPIDFDGKFFLNDYVKFVALKTNNEFIDSKLKLSNSLLDILNKKNINQKEREKNIIEKLEGEKKFDSSNPNGVLEDTRTLKLLDLLYNLENNNNSLLFSETSSEIIASQINLVKQIKDKIRKISFEPNFEIVSDKQVFKNKYLIRNLVLNFVISFVVFFAIVIFKQIFRDFLKK